MVLFAPARVRVAVLAPVLAAALVTSGCSKATDGPEPTPGGAPPAAAGVVELSPDAFGPGWASSSKGASLEICGRALPEGNGESSHFLAPGGALVTISFSTEPASVDQLVSDCPLDFDGEHHLELTAVTEDESTAVLRHVTDDGVTVAQQVATSATLARGGVLVVVDDSDADTATAELGAFVLAVSQTAQATLAGKVSEPIGGIGSVPVPDALLPDHVVIDDALVGGTGFSEELANETTP